MSKIITIFGATGVQGGSVVETILTHPTLSKEYKVRAVTRDPSKPNAQKLVARGAEAVKADSNDYDSIRSAIQGSHAVFGVTNFWESQSRTTEVKQGKAIADASKAAGVKHLIFSTLADVSKLTHGTLVHVSHFDGKAEIAEYIESIKGDDMTSTFFMPGFYMSNIKDGIKRQADVPTYALPWHAETTHVPLFDTASDTGKFVGGILLADPAKMNGREIHAVSQWSTPNEIVEQLSQTIGTQVVFKQIPEKVFMSFLPPPVAEELTENFVLIRDYSYYGKGSEKEQPEHDQVLGDLKTTSWIEFVEKNGPWEFK